MIGGLGQVGGRLFEARATRGRLTITEKEMRLGIH